MENHYQDAIDAMKDLPDILEASRKKPDHDRNEYTKATTRIVDKTINEFILNKGSFDVYSEVLVYYVLARCHLAIGVNDIANWKENIRDFLEKISQKEYESSDEEDAIACSYHLLESLTCN